jgi:SAM (Sterile alpha motif) domain-containing protein
MSTIAEWLASLGMSEYADRFAENGIDVSALRHVTDQDLKDIGVLLGIGERCWQRLAKLPALLRQRLIRQS